MCHRHDIKWWTSTGQSVKQRIKYGSNFCLSNFPSSSIWGMIEKKKNWEKGSSSVKPSDRIFDKSDVVIDCGHKTPFNENSA